MKANSTLVSQTYLEDKISSLMQKASLSFTDEQVSKLAKLVLLLIKWNKSLNLTAIKDPDDMVVLHIIDCAVISPLLLGKNIADVGTGAGFPGLVIAILNEDKHFTLIDSVGKKLSFVRTAVVELGLKNVTIIHDRCENIQLETLCDCVVCRAFAPLKSIVNWCYNLLKEDGVFLAMKANLEENELSEIPSCVKIDKVLELNVPNLDAKRQAVFLSKVKS